MTDYIPRDEAIAEFVELTKPVKQIKDGFLITTMRDLDIHAIKRVLNRLPAADVVEVVRCKDCENYQTDWQPMSFDDGHYCAMVDTMMPYDGFCHMGERREDE